MDLERARQFLRDHHRGVMSTYRADGSPQLSPVVCALDADGLVVVSTRQGAYKVRNLRREPRMALCVLSDGFYGPWVQVSGPVTIVDLPEAMDGLVDYYRRVSGEHEDWADYRAAMERERRCLVRMTIERAGPDVAG